MKLISVLFLFIFCSFTIPFNQESKKPTTTVLICLSSTAYAYHSHYCSGLKRCTHNVSKVEKATAISNGYKACKICY